MHQCFIYDMIDSIMSALMSQHTATSIIIFGGTGDLAQTKLLPSLFRLYRAGALPSTFTVLGISRKGLSDGEYQAFAREAIVAAEPQAASPQLDTFLANLRYLSGSFTDTQTYEAMKQHLMAFDTSTGVCGNKLFYLAVPPHLYHDIFVALHASAALSLCDEHTSWARLLVEKPFGNDLITAQALERTLTDRFSDHQVYRIDHYLAKDAIENILALRFSNSLLANAWDATQVESIEVRLFETKTVSNRGAFYDSLGTLRDVGQNHMLQILALLIMPSVEIDNAASVRRGRAQALSDLATHKIKTLVRGQYEGYASTDGVGEGSETETYFKLVTEATEGLWAGVAITLEAGKALEEQLNEAVVTFKNPNVCTCAHAPVPHHHKNRLRIRFSPSQHIALSMWVKKPGLTHELIEEELVVVHTSSHHAYSPEAYERVLYDCIIGDQTRFVSGAEVEAAWQTIMPIVEKFQTLPLFVYEPGSSGPKGDNQ